METVAEIRLDRGEASPAAANAGRALVLYRRCGDRPGQERVLRVLARIRQGPAATM